MEIPRKRKSLRDFAPAGTKDCEMKCDREPVMTPDGPVVVCHGCKRIVIDSRKGKR
jgi:hypothetical protein